MGLFENFHEIIFQTETEHFLLYCSKRDKIVPWSENVTNALKSSDACIMRPKLDCSFANHLTCSRIMNTSPPWTEVYEENIFLLELICCEHSESMTHLFLLPTDLSLTDRTSHCSSSLSTSSVTLASGRFFFWSQHSDLMCPFCDNSCRSNSCILSYPWNFHYYTSPLNNELARNHHDETHHQLGVNIVLVEQMLLDLIDFNCWLASIDDSFPKALIWEGK